jgi:Domain of unknown function (DUF5134)
MTGPAWLADALAGVMIATAAYCLGRMAAARRWQRLTSYDVDGLHVMMGVAMAGMLAPQLSPLTHSAWARDSGGILFGLAAAWFGWRAARGLRQQDGGTGSTGAAHHLQHLLACGAMVYMVLSVVPPRTGGSAGGMAMGGPAGTGIPGAAPGIPALALGLAVGLLGYTVWTTDRLTSLGRVSQGQAGAVGQVTASRGVSELLVPMSVRLSACCDIVMGVTMGYMLITML